MMITEFIEQYHLGGIFVGLTTFLIIGIYHPLVIKGEYYFGQKIRWWFLVAALAFLAASVYVDGIILSTLFGVASFRLAMEHKGSRRAGRKSAQRLVPGKSGKNSPK